MKIRTCISDRLPPPGKGIRFAIYQGEGPAGSRDAIEFNLIKLERVVESAAKLSTGKWTAVPYPDISKNLIPCHALENGIFISYCNRCREETIEGQVVGRFLGNSVVADPHGRILSAASNEETLLLTDCVPSDYGPTHPENTYYLKDRRPEHYSVLLKRVSSERESKCK